MQVLRFLQGSAPCWQSWQAPHQLLSRRRLLQRCSPLLGRSQAPCRAAGDGVRVLILTSLSPDGTPGDVSGAAMLTLSHTSGTSLGPFN